MNSEVEEKIKMPKSKRDKKVALTKTQKKVGLETKQVSFKHLAYLAVFDYISKNGTEKRYFHLP